MLIGGVAIFWFIILYFTIENSPLEDTIITKQERAHFEVVCEQVVQDKVSIFKWEFLIICYICRPNSLIFHIVEFSEYYTGINSVEIFIYLHSSSCILE